MSYFEFVLDSSYDLVRKNHYVIQLHTDEMKMNFLTFDKAEEDKEWFFDSHTDYYNYTEKKYISNLKKFVEQISENKNCKITLQQYHIHYHFEYSKKKGDFTVNMHFNDIGFSYSFNIEKYNVIEAFDNLFFNLEHCLI